MNRLLEIGFVPVGHWKLTNGKLECELNRHSTQKNILYAFVCDGQVKYVGKTVRPLAIRMAGYTAPSKTQSTNIRNNRRISELLSMGGGVEILALPDSGLLHYGQFHLNLAAALEDAIIRGINPEWNGGAVEEQISGADMPSELVQSATNKIGSFSFTLHPTYYRTGFFNVSITSQQLIGGDGETIELFLGGATQPILGSINRRANSNGTPRIMGGSGLKDWFHENAREMSLIAVEVASPNAIRLRTTEALEKDS